MNNFKHLTQHIDPPPSALPWSSVDQLKSPCVTWFNLDKTWTFWKLSFSWMMYLIKAQELYTIDSSLSQGCPPPISTKKANLDPLVNQIITEFGFQKLGFIRSQKKYFLCLIIIIRDVMSI